MGLSSSQSEDFYFLRGGGEMGALIRAKDWSNTSLGKPEHWPQSLRIMVAAMLDNPFGMYIAWGKNYIQLYNDGYRPILGSTKHPQALGISTKETFSEIWHIVKPMFDDVMSGRAVLASDFMYELNRNGFIEECYFDFSYSPIRLDDGEVGGVLVTVIETTNKKRAEDALKESEKRFRMMADNIPNLAWMAEADGSIFWYNKKWYEYTGTTPDQMRGWGWQSVHDPAQLPKVLERWTGSISSGQPFEMIFPLKGADGSFKQFLTRVLPLRDDQGKIYQWFGSNTDITDQIEAEHKLKESEERFRTMAEGTKVLIAVGDETGKIIYFNQAWVDLTGRPVKELLKFGWVDLIHPDDRDKYVNSYLDSFSRKKPFKGEFRILNKKEDYTWLFVQAPPRFRNDGSFAGYISSAVDITEQVLAHKKTEEAEEKARLAISSANLGVYEIIYRTNEMVTDQRFKEIWGTNAAVKREQYVASIHTDDLLLREKAHKESLLSGQLFYEARVLWKDRSVHWVRVTGKVIFDDKKVPAKLIGVIQDITDTVLNQEKIKESENNLRQTILQAPVAMCILKGPDHVVELANERMIELWGKTSKDVLDKPIFEGLPEAKDQGFENLLDGVYNTGKTFAAEGVPIMLPRSEGLEKVYVNFVYKAYQRVEGTISGILVVAVDVTDQVAAHQKIEKVVASRTKELADANKKLEKSNAELAQFAYIASHDLQEPLRKISTFTQMLENRIRNQIDETSRKYLDKIFNASVRMDTLIRDILLYSELEKEIVVFAEVDLNKIIENLLIDYELLIEQKGASVQFDRLPVIEAIPLQMTQLFGNLLGNALKFSRNNVKPVITISCSKLTIDEIKNLKLDPEWDFIKIVMRDNGIGFKEEYAHKIFNIFQRLHLKSDYEGTGIGLAMCKKIAFNHKGDLTASGSSENGAVFNVFLPLKHRRPEDHLEG